MPRILESTLQRIQDATDITALAESYGLQLKRVGSAFKSLCPFHDDKNPSLHINPRMQIFNCFSCGTKGGVFRFVQLMERCEFLDAVRILAERSGIPVEYDGTGHTDPSAEARRRDQRQALFWVNGIARDYFRESFADATEGRAARAYLEARGFTQESIDHWQLGWAPDSWDGLMTYFRRRLKAAGGEHKWEQGLSHACEAGLFRVNEESGRTYDAFRGRVMFPILDQQQRIIGFGGRVLEEQEGVGKYLNTAEGPLFAKRRLLYGLSHAAKDIGFQNTAVVVEGYTDTIMCHQYGLRNVVATLGTALTEEHIRLLRRYIQGGKVVALFDSDEAGRKATLRAVELFMEQDVPLYIVQGLAVKDAGDFLPQFGAEPFREAIDAAKESFQYTLEQQLGRVPDGDHNAKSAAIAGVMEVVNRCPNAMKREMMRRTVAATAHVPEEVLPRPVPRPEPRAGGGDGSRDTARRGLQGHREGGTDGAATTFTLPADAKREGRIAAEHRLLLFMYRDAAWCHEIADVYPPDHWLDAPGSDAAALLRDAWEGEGGEPPALDTLIRTTTNESIRGLLIDLLGQEEEGIEPREGELREILNRLRRAELEESKEHLQEELRNAEAKGDREQADALLLRNLELEREIRRLKGFDAPA